MSAQPTEPEPMIPRHVLMKVLNRRRRLLWWERNYGPPKQIQQERDAARQGAGRPLRVG